jgi:hypothetical protein
MYKVNVGNRHSLVFPVMCNAHLLLDYSRNVPNTLTGSRTDDVTIGIWDIETSFTIETILTPYDCAGNSGASITTSEKTLPYNTNTNSQSRKFLDTANRPTYSMCIFYSDTAQLYLVNTSSTTTKPAEYKLQFVVTADGGSGDATSTLNSPAIIKGVSSYPTNSEALYLITPYHIAASFNAATGSMDIIVNNILVASSVHSSKSSRTLDFKMANTDCYIGSIPPTGTWSNDGEASYRKQFMGELHELCITEGHQTEFAGIHTLVPNYENLKLYLRFEETDL